MRGVSTLETTSRTSIRSHLPSGILKKPFLLKSPGGAIESPSPADGGVGKTLLESSQTALPRPQPIENWIVVLTIVASAVVAWLHIRSGSIWYDEALTLLMTSGRATLGDWSLGMGQFKPTANLLKILSQLYTYDVHPPLYFWLLAIWRVLLGSSLEVARMFSAFFTLATLALVYRYAVGLGLRWPCVPVVVYAASAAGLRYAYNARPYAMATFLIILTLYLAHRKSRWTGALRSGLRCHTLLCGFVYRSHHCY